MNARTRRPHAAAATAAYVLVHVLLAAVLCAMAVGDRLASSRPAFVLAATRFDAASRLGAACCSLSARQASGGRYSVALAEGTRRHGCWLALRQTTGDGDVAGGLDGDLPVAAELPGAADQHGEASVPPPTADLADAGNAGEEETGESTEAAPSTAEVHLGRKTIGVDHGRKRTGVCVSIGYAPRPLPLISHDDNSTDVALQVAHLALREGAEQIVVGFPFNSTGGEGEQAVYTRQFVTHLQEACTTCAIYLWDERFSSSVAREKLQQAGYTRMDMKGMVDTVASIGILSDFFDKNGQGAEMIQIRPAGLVPGAGGTMQPLVPVLSYKERLKQMQAATVTDAGALQGKTKRKKRK